MEIVILVISRYRSSKAADESRIALDRMSVQKDWDTFRRSLPMWLIGGEPAGNAMIQRNVNGFITNPVPYNGKIG